MGEWLPGKCVQQACGLPSDAFPIGLANRFKMKTRQFARMRNSRFSHPSRTKAAGLHVIRQAVEPLDALAAVWHC